MTTPIRCALLALVLAACGTPSMTFEGDADHDTIPDDFEGADAEVDTDGDGTPDFLDPDSDDDGIPDALEAGDDVPATLPYDSDRDAVPDFRDLDSDANGLPDAREGLGDTDEDGALDAADPDDDGDGLDDILELAGRVDFPPDTDGDGAPDFRDPDSDGDTIADREEATEDVDGDGMPDRFDLDSDDDGVEDALEANDTSLATPAPDTDGDGAPDYRDRDADGDGLPDGVELEDGTSWTDGDSDDDGVSDLIEVGAGTDPRDPDVSPRSRGDFVFVMPFREAAMPPRDTLEFRTHIAYADLYFLFDATGSMLGEISAMQSAVEGILDNLTCDDFGTPCTSDPQCAAGQACGATGTCITNPSTTGCIASLWTGVGAYGGSPDSYRNFLSIQPSPAETRRRLPSVGSAGSGGEETVFQAVACVGDPSACRNADCATSGGGCPGYRRDALRALVLIGDERNGCTSCSVNSATGAGDRLRAEDILFVAVDADAAQSPRTDFHAISRASGSLDPSGQPYYVAATEAAVVDGVTDIVRRLVDGRPQLVAIESVDEAGDDGDALQFIERLEVNISGTGACTAIPAVADTDDDGHADAFSGVPAGTPVCWDVVARDNDRVRTYDRPLVFRARLTVRGDSAVLDARTIYFLVPPIIEPPIFG